MGDLKIFMLVKSICEQPIYFCVFSTFVNAMYFVSIIHGTLIRRLFRVPLFNVVYFSIILCSFDIQLLFVLLITFSQLYLFLHSCK